jgi:MFS family permease
MVATKPYGPALTVPEAIEIVGFGPAQLIAGSIGGGIFLCGGALILMAGSLTHSIGQALLLEPWQRASLMSLLFCGMLLGNSVSGPLSDSYGRRGMILVGLVSTVTVGYVSTFAMTFWTLSIWRLLLGAALGLGLPPWMALCTEITPAAWRMPLSAYAQALFVVGEIYSALLILHSDSTMQNLDWRFLTRASLIPYFIIAGLNWMFLIQSPAYLATKGQHDKALEVLTTMSRQNGAPALQGSLRKESPMKHVESGSSAELRFAAVFGRRMFFSTATVVYSCFVLNLILYGMIYGLPQVARNVDSGYSAAMTVLFGAFSELPGLAAGALFGVWFRRLPVMCGCFAGLAIAMGCLGFGVAMNDLSISQYLIQGAVIAAKMLSNTGFVVVYQYASEIYPALARATGSAVCVSGGRLGSILAPVVFEGLHDYTHSYAAFFWLSFVCAAGNCLLVLFLPFETAGRSLDEETEPVLSKEKGSLTLKVAV